MHLESVAILPDHAGQGIGRMLIAFVESESRRCGYPAVELYTNEKMVENLALYPKLGYRETGRHYEAGFNRVYFRKTLDVDPVPTPGAIVLRRATVADAPQFIDLWRTLDAESEYLMYEPGERQTTVAQQQAYLSDMEHSELAAVFVLDETAADGLVGFAGGRRSATRRDRHVLRLVIAIRQSHIGLGYGLSLLEALESWARTKGVTRLELGVMAGNEHAIALYRKFGFAHEGTRINGVHLASGYVDEHLMGKWLGPVATT